MLAVKSDLQVRGELARRLKDARSRADELFDLVRPDSLYERPIPERHRIIFYLGHLEAFDWNLLSRRALGLKPFHPEFDRLFAFGIDPVGGGLPSDQPADWPSVADVRHYVSQSRQVVDAGLRAALPSHSKVAGSQSEFPLNLLLNVAIEHRLMHAETLTYMLHQLPLHQKFQQSRKPELVVPPVSPRMMEIPAGNVTLGTSSRDEGSFGWDNEYETQSVPVATFAIDRYKVTNGEYLEFMADGGYEDQSFWRNDDWDWKTKHDISHPVFWQHREDRWIYRTMFEEIPLPSDRPVYVSQAEASAYARWVKKALPTEAQWHRAAYGTTDGSERFYPWGEEPPSARFGNFDFRNWEAVPSCAFPQAQSAFGVADLLGNGWEWTSSVFEPFPGFQPFPFYPGYSADFFDGKHYVLKGASARTAACFLRRSFRNWFQPHYQYVYSGFRCVSN